MRVETFVVQIWAPADDVEAGPGRLPGFVEHVGSGRREAFRELGELLAFLRSAATHEGDPAPEGAPFWRAARASQDLAP